MKAAKFQNYELEKGEARHMTPKKALVVSVPSDVREWIIKAAGERRMTISDFALRLMTLGIQSDAIETGVAKLSAAIEAGGVARAMLKEVLATRFIVLAHANGQIDSATRLDVDANAYTEHEMERIWPERSVQDEH